LFTERASAWWPPDRRHTKDPESEIAMLASGRFYERARDGHEVELGRVREHSPPDLLVLDFYVGTDAAHPTEVVVRFTPEGDRTRVSIEHRPTAASEGLWSTRAPRYDRSWEAVLAALARASHTD
ncbi:MAG TPA: SRPBCC domain-containing protein, partial [Minicystis sp.]|nr:SRPBCC domain-containing protein [Minicystis sp.]